MLPIDLTCPQGYHGVSVGHLMSRNYTELKFLFQELNENPYRRLNLAFLLISVIPLLALAYVLFDKVFIGNKSFSDVGPILGCAATILILGYIVAYGVIKNIINKTLLYAAKAKHADEIKSTFAMSLAHDLKSPVATIKANIANLQAGFLGSLTPQQKDAVAVCNEVSDRMNTITTNLISAYMIEARKTEMTLTTFDLRQIIEAQNRELMTIAREKKIALQIDLCKNPLWINADHEKITRAVNNLLNNSIKHTPEAGKVTVKTYPTDGLARVDFFNTGTPIPHDKLEKIFDKFERLNTLIEGQGLGLSIAKDIIELHGGKIWATSNPSEPNCFTILLTLNEARP